VNSPNPLTAYTTPPCRRSATARSRIITTPRTSG
jgi:hypothetical protein